MKKTLSFVLVLALTLSMALSVVPFFTAFADEAVEITDNSGYGGGIRKKSDGSILFSPFISPLREAVNGGANLSDYTIDMTFTQLTGKGGEAVHTFDTVSASINKSNGQYFDIYLNGKLGNSGFCPARKVNVKDTTGAGDAFCAGVAIGLTYGKTLGEACEIGSMLAASVIVTTESVCPRFLPRELGLDIDVVD